MTETPEWSLRAQVERALSAGITSGEIRPGTLLAVPKVAARYRVSATPAREAMLELQRRGFVVPARNRGFLVTAVDDDHARHVAEVRSRLEPYAMSRLAPQFDPDDAPPLRALSSEIRRGAETADFALYLDADRRFHLALTDLVGNPMLTVIVADLRARTRLPGLVELLGHEELRATCAEHDRLLDLLIEHDGAGAEALMRTHIGHTVGWWAGRTERATDTEAQPAAAIG